MNNLSKSIYEQFTRFKTVICTSFARLKDKMLPASGRHYPLPPTRNSPLDPAWAPPKTSVRLTLAISTCTLIRNYIYDN